MEIVATKVCRKCGDVKPLDGFHKQASSSDGRQAYCRDCNSRVAAAKKRERKLASPEYAASLSAYKKAHYAANSAGHKASAQAWRAANPERLAAQQAAYNDVHHDRRLESGERYRAANREKRRAAWSAWYRANQGVARQFARTRHQRIRDLTVVPFTAEQLESRLAYFGWRCWMCGGPFEHVDHVKPVSKGGIHALSNLRPSCAPCNSWKHAKWYGVAELSRFIRT